MGEAANLDGWTWKPAVLTVAPIAGFFALLIALGVGLAAHTKPEPTYPVIRYCRDGGQIVRVHGVRALQRRGDLTPIDPAAALDDVCRRRR